MRNVLRSIAALAPLLAGCGGAGAPESPSGPPVRGDGVLFSLLAFGGQMEVVSSPEQGPEQGLLRPRSSGEIDSGQLPAVIVVAPTTVAYTVPDAHAEAEFIYSLAIHAGDFRGSGRVTFTGTLDGAPLFEHVLDCSRTVPAEERIWNTFRAPMPRGGRLELETRYEGNQETGPRVGWGLLRVSVPFEVPRSRASVDQPNVLLILVDTLRADRLSSYGGREGTSPRLDELAARGARFENPYSSAPWTIPGTASVLTGQSPPEHGLGASPSYYLADATDTLAEHFQRAGLTTGAFTCNPLIAPARNFDQGFEYFRNYRWARALHVTPDVLTWMREHREERFFLYVHHVDPHAPYEPTASSRERFVPEPAEGATERDLRGTLRSYYTDGSVDVAQAQASSDHQSNLYDGEVFDVDHEIGLLLDELEALGLSDRTLVCVTSDHGEEFLEHGWAGHHEQLFDESVRVPLIFAGPGVPGGVVREEPVENRFAATSLLALAGVVPASGLPGPNLIDPEEFELATEPGVFVMNTKGTWADFSRREKKKLGSVHSLIRDGWRLVQSPRPPENGEPLFALYDLATDPGCDENVAHLHPERVEEMRQRIRTWLEEGRARQPRMVPSAEETEDMLRALGYIGDD